ncbi:MAG: hypothetical protein Q9164_004912 [Protoblastenia rupestris]
MAWVGQALRAGQNIEILDCVGQSYGYLRNQMSAPPEYFPLATTPHSLHLDQKTYRMILGKESSILGYPGEVSLPLAADHHNVCKFLDTQDYNYKCVKSVLQTLTSKILKENTSKPAPAASGDMSKVGLLLSVSGAPTEDLMNLHKLRATGTCESLLTATQLKEWLFNDSRSGIVWMHARPGSGKSVKASFLVDHLKGAGRLCHYYFFKYQDSTKRSLNSLLRYLAYQLAQDVCSTRDILGRMADEGLRFEKTDGLSIWHTLFEPILPKMSSQKPIYWVIDALDESDSPKAVIESLSGIPYNTPIRVIIISRSIPTISMAFDRAATRTVINVLCIDDNADDIRKYAESEMELMHGALEFRHRVTSQIVERAEGNFLWAHLALQEIMQSHSEEDCWRALEEVPSGMEPLYQRMENSIARLSKPIDRTLARLLLIWATYSRRPPSVEELLQALNPKYPTILDLPYTITQICGQFVTVDSNQRVSLIHKTAREYLMQASKLPFSFTPQESHEELFERSISVFFDTKIQENLSRKMLPPLYLYAATSWAYHLSYIPPELDNPLDLLIKFFSGPHVLAWIEALAISNQLQVPVSTSRSLSSYIRRRRKLDAIKAPMQCRVTGLKLLELWPIDLLKLVGKFGGRLLQDSTAIYKFIPQLSPRNSGLNQQFGSSPLSGISVTGVSSADWDDLLSRISIGRAEKALMITCSGRFVAVLTSTGVIMLFNVLTFGQIRTFSHLEYCFKMCFNSSGDRLATYGLRTIKVWDTTTGRLLISAPNPPNARAMDICFAENDTVLLMLTDVRVAWLFDMRVAAGRWQNLHAEIFEPENRIEGAFTNSPTSLSFNNDSTQIVVGYRGSPVEIWDFAPLKFTHRCRRRHRKSNQAKRNWTGTVRTQWHPNSGEVLGIYTDGIVFKWHPHTESYTELSGECNSAPSEIQSSPDGLVFATSDVKGVVKLYNHDDFTLIYQLSSEDTVTSLCFSPDSRRFYDIRGSYCNIWEPNALMRLSDVDERDLETESDAGSSTNVSQYASEAWVDSSSPITTLAASPQGLLICAGNDDGTVFVRDTTHDKKLEIATSSYDMSIELVAWSDNGKYLAYLDLSGKLVVRAVAAQVEKQLEARWVQRTVMDVRIRLDKGGAQQLFFNPDSTLCLVANRQHAQVWSLLSRSICAEYRPSSEPDTCDIWVNHPSEPKNLLAFRNSTIAEHSWADFTKSSEWKIDTTFMAAGRVNVAPQEEEESENRPGLRRKQSRSGPKSNEMILIQVEVSFLRELFILSFAQPGSSGNGHSKLFMIPLSSLSPHSPSIVDRVITLPQDVSEAIERPLNIMGRDRLVFIDESFWVCTYHIDIDGISSNNSAVGRRSGADSETLDDEEKGMRKLSIATTVVERRRSGIPSSRLVRHFFLPQDWVNADVLRLCQVTVDGRFLCPRKGEIAVIKSGLGSDW